MTPNKKYPNNYEFNFISNTDDDDDLDYEYSDIEDSPTDTENNSQTDLDDIIDDDDIDSSDDDDDEEDDEKSTTEDEDIESDDTELDVYYKYNTNKHRREGKHALRWDSIMKGKKNDEEETQKIEEELYTNTGIYEYTDSSIEKGTDFDYESKHFMDYMTKKNLSEDVYNILAERTDIDFTAPRRKPNKQTLNIYYKMLLDNMSHKYTNYEIFVELSYYFTDNIFNMYKLLDKRYATKIINELKDRGYLNDLKNIKFV